MVFNGQGPFIMKSPYLLYWMPMMRSPPADDYKYNEAESDDFMFGDDDDDMMMMLQIMMMLKIIRNPPAAKTLSPFGCRIGPPERGKGQDDEEI